VLLKEKRTTKRHERQEQNLDNIQPRMRFVLVLLNIYSAYLHRTADLVFLKTFTSVVKKKGIFFICG